MAGLDLKKLGIDPTHYKIDKIQPQTGYQNGEAITLIADLPGVHVRGTYVVAERNGGKQIETLTFLGTRQSLGRGLYLRLAKRLRKNEKLPSEGQLEKIS